MVNGPEMTSFRHNEKRNIDHNLIETETCQQFGKCWTVSIYIDFLLNFVDWYIDIVSLSLSLFKTNNIESDTFRHYSKSDQVIFVIRF